MKKADEIRNYFISHEETIAVAESVTSGGLQLALSHIADAEQFYQGGITTYNIGQKSKLLDIEPIHAKRNNCVSAVIAEQMAANVCQLFKSDWGIGITGYASPVPESQGLLFCYFAICHKGTIRASYKLTSKEMNPDKVQHFYTRKVLDKLVEIIQLRNND